jgi:hypothetical protein
MPRLPASLRCNQTDVHEMKRYLFTRELFRSRTIALAHVILFGVMFYRTLGWFWIVPLLFWAFVTGYNTYARWKELRFSWGATLRYLEAQRAANESALDADDGVSLGYCFDCASEGLQIDAQFLVSAGPQGEKKPVCMIHARAQAVQNGKDADKPKEVAA